MFLAGWSEWASAHHSFILGYWCPILTNPEFSRWAPGAVCPNYGHMWFPRCTKVAGFAACSHEHFCSVGHWWWRHPLMRTSPTTANHHYLHRLPMWKMTASAVPRHCWTPIVSTATIQPTQQKHKSPPSLETPTSPPSLPPSSRETRGGRGGWILNLISLQPLWRWCGRQQVAADTDTDGCRCSCQHGQQQQQRCQREWERQLLLQESDERTRCATVFNFYSIYLHP